MKPLRSHPMNVQHRVAAIRLEMMRQNSGRTMMEATTRALKIVLAVRRSR